MQQFLKTKQTEINIHGPCRLALTPVGMSIKIYMYTYVKIFWNKKETCEHDFPVLLLVSLLWDQTAQKTMMLCIFKEIMDRII